MNRKILIILSVIIGVYVMVKMKLSDLSIKAISAISTMAAAIQSFEGWDPGSRSYRNNNPGNLRSKTLPTYLKGAIGLDDEKHVIFDTYENGYNALIRQLKLAFTGKSNNFNPDMTLYQFFDKYAEANSGNYARAVAEKLGVSPETTLNELS